MIVVFVYVFDHCYLNAVQNCQINYCFHLVSRVHCHYLVLKPLLSSLVLSSFLGSFLDLIVYKIKFLSYNHHLMTPCHLLNLGCK